MAMYHIMYLVAASHFSDFKLGSFNVTGTCTCKSTTQRELVNEDRKEAAAASLLVHLDSNFKTFDFPVRWRYLSEMP